VSRYSVDTFITNIFNDHYPFHYLHRFHRLLTLSLTLSPGIDAGARDITVKFCVRTFDVLVEDDGRGISQEDMEVICRANGGLLSLSLAFPLPQMRLQYSYICYPLMYSALHSDVEDICEERFGKPEDFWVSGSGIVLSQSCQHTRSGVSNRKLRLCFQESCIGESLCSVESL